MTTQSIGYGRAPCNLERLKIVYRCIYVTRRIPRAISPVSGVDRASLGYLGLRTRGNLDAPRYPSEHDKATVPATPGGSAMISAAGKLPEHRKGFFGSPESGKPMSSAPSDRDAGIVPAGPPAALRGLIAGAPLKVRFAWR